MQLLLIVRQDNKYDDCGSQMDDDDDDDNFVLLYLYSITRANLIHPSWGSLTHSALTRMV